MSDVREFGYILFEHIPIRKVVYILCFSRLHAIIDGKP